MRPVHYITLAVALVAIAVLYKWGNTTPPTNKTEGVAQHPGPEKPGQMPMSAVIPASFDSILNAAAAQLPAHAVTDIEAVKKNIGATRDSAHMAPFFIDLAKIWQEHKNMPVAAHYYAKAGKLENSEKNLNFAGQLFLNLMHESTSAPVQMWEAQEAVACFQRSLEINPNNDTTKMALASGFIEGTGETMQGVQLLLGITREKPDNIPANLMLGRLAVQSGQYDKAIGRFETILKQEPRNTEAMYFLAEAYKGKGNKEKAIELLEACKKIVNRPEFSKDIDQYITSFK